MAPRVRVALLARAFARRCYSNAENRELELFKKEITKRRMEFEADIEHKVNQQDLKLKELEGEFDMLKGKIEEEVNLNKIDQETHSEKLKGALDNLQFSFIKGAAGFIAFSAAVCTLMVNVSRVFPGAWKGWQIDSVIVEEASEGIAAKVVSVNDAAKNSK